MWMEIQYFLKLFVHRIFLKTMSSKNMHAQVNRKSLRKREAEATCKSEKF